MVFPFPLMPCFFAKFFLEYLFVNHRCNPAHGKAEQKILNAKTETELDYLGVGTFGDNEVLKQLTKKFSLWK